MITVVEKYIIKPKKIGAFKIIINEIIEETRKENGCISYELNEEISDCNNIFTLIAKWECEDDIKEHNKSIHIKFLMPQIDRYKEDIEELDIAI